MLIKPAMVVSSLSGLLLLLLCLFVVGADDRSQTSITAPLVVLSAIFTLSWCVPLARGSKAKVDWFHPAILILVFYWIYFLFSGAWLWLVHDYQSTLVDLGTHAPSVVNEVFCLGFLSVAAYGIGARSRRLFARAFARGDSAGRPVFVPLTIGSKEIAIIALPYFILGSAFKTYHILQLGPLSTDILLYLSPSASADLGLSISQFVIMMESMLDWSVLLAVLSIMESYRRTGRVRSWWWVGPAVVAVAAIDYIVSGKRSSVIFFMLLPAIWYHYLIHRLSRKSALFVGAAVAIAIIGLLVGRVVLPLVTRDLSPTDYIGVNVLDVLVFYVDSSELSSFDMVAATLVYGGDLLHAAGGSLGGFIEFTFGSLVVFVPRLVWPGKPDYLELGQIYRSVLIGPQEGMGFSVTIWGAQYLFFGLAGLLTSLFVIGWFLEAAYALFRPWSGSAATVVLYSILFWMTFHALRFGTLGFVTLLIVQSMLVGIVAMLVIGRRSWVSFRGFAARV